MLVVKILLLEGNGADAQQLMLPQLVKMQKHLIIAVALGSGSVTKGAIAYQSDTFWGKNIYLQVDHQAV